MPSLLCKKPLEEMTLSELKGDVRRLKALLAQVEGEIEAREKQEEAE